MIRIVGAILCAGTLAGGCSQAMMTGTSSAPRTPVALSPVDTDKVQVSVRKVLIDPESARFEPIVAGRTPEGAIVVCGWVNSRNRMGGYAGKQPFSGVMVGADFKLDDLGSDYIKRALIQDKCGTLGDFYYGNA